jgi:hypothetical protein
MDLVDALASLEQTVTLWCMSIDASSEPDTTQFSEILALREHISSTIQQLELTRTKWATRDLSGPIHQVNRLTSEIQDTEREVSHARDIMDKVTGALDIAGKAAGALGV